MKKQFSKLYLEKNQGCYSEVEGKLLKCTFMAKKDPIELLEIINSEIPLKDKGWFLIKKCDLTLDQKSQIAFLLARSVATIYNKKYPNDSRINECIEAVE